MKKTIISLAVLAAASSVAQAQSNVSIYGIVDAGFVSERGGAAGTKNNISSGVASTSRIGFRGNEDLGNGLSAVFVAENGFQADTGALKTANTLFDRQAYVGLKSKELGAVTLGRQYTPWYNVLTQVADPFAGGYTGSSKNLFTAASVITRLSNTVVYASPVVAGFNADVMYSLGEQANSNVAQRQIGLSVGYVNGPLTARVAYNNKNADKAANLITGAGYVSVESARNTLFAANYDFKVAKAFLAYGIDKGLDSSPIPAAGANPYNNAKSLIGSKDSTDLLVGATAPVGAAGTAIASYIRKNDKTVNDQDATQWALGYSYALSKRTSTYVSYAKINNKNGAGYTVGTNSDNGTGDKSFAAGVRHSF